MRALTKSCEDPLNWDNTEAESPRIGQLKTCRTQEGGQIKLTRTPEQRIVFSLSINENATT